MSDSETQPPEELSNAPEYGLSTDILNLIQDNVKILVDEYPDKSLATIIYTLTLTVVRSPQLRRTNGSMVPDILVYYLESYKRYRQYQEPDVEDQNRFLNEASLTLFDLYVEDPHNQTKRKLIELVAGSIREHWIDKIVKDESVEGLDEFTIVNNLTLLTETISKYTARPKRDKNLTYVAWLKVVFEKLFQTNDFTPLKDGSDILRVIDQILKRRKIIFVTVH